MKDKELIALRILAVSIALRALTNVFKPFGAGSGLVFFGGMLTGAPMFVLAPLMGVLMLVYAYGMWNERRFALPMGIVYAIFVVFNTLLFPIVHGLGEKIPALAYLLFAVLGIGGTWASVWLLQRRKLN